jgi:hypothetical protein
MHRIIYIIFCLFIGYNGVAAQELNMKITINSSKIETVDKSIFTMLEESLNQFVNGRKWTDATFAANELIESSMLITINEISDQDTYKADIQITSTRPVYNSSYSTPLFNFKDDEFEFFFLRGQNMEFSENNINSNLTAVIAYYAYIVIGLDFDSFSLGGGKPYFERAMNIANSAQSLNVKGWAPFGSDRNRYSLALALTEEPSADFHSMWYNYHRKGLDEMAINATRGRATIEATIPDLQKIHQARPASPILLFYGDTKLDELMNIYSEAQTNEKQEAYKILQSIYPTKKYILEVLKR